MSNIIRFQDLSYEEKLKLIDDEVSDYIKIECAFEGVKLLPEPDEPSEPELGEKTDYFRIGYVSDLTFLKLEDAERALKILRTCDVITTNWTGDYSYVNKIKKFDAKITTEIYHSKEQYDRNKDELEKYKREKESYDELKKEFDKANNLLMRIQDDIWSQMKEIRALDNLQKETTEVYLGYLDMAKGDAEIAINFLMKAYQDSLDKLKEGLGKERYDRFALDLKSKKLVKESK